MNTDLSVNVSIAGQVSTAGDFGLIKQDLLARALLNFTTGTGTGQADVVFSDTRTLASNTSENLDLNGGGLLDVFCGAANFSKVVVLFIRAKSTNVNNVLVGGAASNGFFPVFGDATDVIKLPPGAGVMLFNDAGWAVAAGTADLLKIANSAVGAAVDYDIIAIGRSA